MFSHWRWLKGVSGFVLFVAGLLRCAQGAEQGQSPGELRYELEVMQGLLWKVGGGATPLTYLLVPQIISLKIPPVTERPWMGGTLVLRSRFSLLLEPIVRGPENYYVGLAAAGELEWRHPSGRFDAFFASGGGFGWMDSRGYVVKGAQGEDFNLNWLIHTGVRYRTHAGWVWSAGAYFQHISNRGLNKINPGLNVLGPTLALSHRF
jgi:lipid A 3-O-deacylase